MYLHKYTERLVTSLLGDQLSSPLLFLSLVRIDLFRCWALSLTTHSHSLSLSLSIFLSISLGLTVNANLLLTQTEVSGEAAIIRFSDDFFGCSIVSCSVHGRRKCYTPFLVISKANSPH